MSRAPLFRVGLLLAAFAGWAGCGDEAAPVDAGAGDGGRGGTVGTAGRGGTVGNAGTGGTGGSVGGELGGTGGSVGGSSGTGGGAGDTGGTGGAAGRGGTGGGGTGGAVGGTGGVAGTGGRGGTGGTGGAAGRGGTGGTGGTVGGTGGVAGTGGRGGRRRDGWHRRRGRHRRRNGVHDGGHVSGADRRQRHGRVHERHVHDHVQHRVSPLRQRVRAQYQPDDVRNDGDDGGVYALSHAGQRHRDVHRRPARVRDQLYDRVPSLWYRRDRDVRDQRQHRHHLVRKQLHRVYGAGQRRGDLQRRGRVRARLQHGLSPVRARRERHLRRQQQHRLGMHGQRLHRVCGGGQRDRRLQRNNVQRHLRNRLSWLPGRASDVVRGEQQRRVRLQRGGLHRVRRSPQWQSGLQRNDVRRGLQHGLSPVRYGRDRDLRGQRQHEHQFVRQHLHGLHAAA